MKKLLLLIFIFDVLNANAQVYNVTFAGTGESSAVGDVQVENLTTGAKATLTGSDILRLTLPTSIDDNGNRDLNGLIIYPNPMDEYSNLFFHPPAEGPAVISVSEINGKAVYKEEIFLSRGPQELRLSGLGKGMHIIRITGNRFQLSGKIYSVGRQSGRITCEKVSSYGKEIFEKKEDIDTKGSQAIIDMPYSSGQYLKFTGASGDFKTVVTSAFSEDKIITFRFFRCTDGDNINYPVVEIGTQVWMALNLRTSRYKNGDLIGTTNPKTLNISTETSPKYQWVYYGYEIVIDTAAYGRLYTWYAATDSRGVCPSGWHLPSQTEWNTLITTLGGPTIAGAKLKETGFTHWSTPNTDASNISGFTALPTGSRAPAGSCTNYTSFSYMWSATARDVNYSWYCALGYNFAAAYSDVNTGKSVGLAVRCVKD